MRMEEEEEGGAGGRKEGGDTELKTKNPHVNVGKRKILKKIFAVFCF